MADDSYTPDVADDPLLPEQQTIPIADGRKAPKQSITGLGQIVRSAGLWGDNAYGSDVPLQPPSAGNGSPGLFGGNLTAPVEITKAFGKTAKDLYGKFKEGTKDIPTGSDEVEAQFPNTQSPVPNVRLPAPKIDVSGVNEQPMGSNDLPPLPDSSINVAKPDTADVWTKGAGPIPGSQYGGGGMAYTPREQVSSDSPRQPADITPKGTGGSAAPAPGAQLGENGHDIFGNSIMGRGIREAFNGFMNWRDQNKMTLMALAGGLASHQESLGRGIGEGFSSAARMLPAQNALNNQNATMQFFMSPQGGGMDMNMARAFAANPALTQEALGQITGYAAPKTMTYKDFLGGEHVKQWDPRTHTWTPLAGVGGTTQGGAEDAPPTSLSPEQWSAATPQQRAESITDPGMKGLVTALLTGGNIQGRMPANTLSIMGQVDPTWQMTKYEGEKTMATGLNKESPSSVGGALIRGLSTFGHYADAAEASAAVGGYSGPDLPGGSLIGQAVTGGRNVLADPRLASAREQEKKQWGTATTEGTTFYANAPGSEGERSSGLKAVGDTATPAMKAGNLRGAAQQLHTKLDQFMDQVMGTNAGRDYFKDPRHAAMIQKYQADADRLDAAIAKLDPTGPEAQARAQRLQAAPQTQAQGAPRTQAAPAAPQQPVIVRQNGHLYQQGPDGKWILVQ